MRVLLDTSVLIRAAKTGVHTLKPAVRKLLSDEETVRILSVISITEIAVKRTIGKLDLEPSVITDAIEDLQLTLLPYMPNHAMRLFDLPLHHREPFNRMLIATALAEAIPLITSDREFSRYSELQIIAA